MRDFHCCATCVHYSYEKNMHTGIRNPHCRRLQYDTKPHYQFNCWEPKPQVRRLMEKQEKEG